MARHCSIFCVTLIRFAILETFTPTGYETRAETFQDLIVEQLANEAAELLSRGLHRDYLRFNGRAGKSRLAE